MPRFGKYYPDRFENGESSESSALRNCGNSKKHVTYATPWIIPSTKRYCAGVIGLHQEIEDFYAWIAPRECEYRMRQNVIDRITEAVRRKYPHALVECFGSFPTGLFLPTSDIDVVVFGKWEQFPLYTLQEEFVRSGICFPHDVKILDKAAVPILKITDQRTGVKVDISFNLVNGINSAKMLNTYIAQFPCLPKLVLVLKQFLQYRELNEVFTGGVSSHCLVMMVISFLQLHPRYFPCDREENLGVLLIEFFELYGRHFNYAETTIIVAGSGSYVPKKSFKKRLSDGESVGLLSIEDPIQTDHDIGRSSYGIMDVRNAFEYAYFQLVRRVTEYDAAGESILSSIFRISDTLVEYRKLLQERYGTAS
ncbi:terminal nucleotidyltransferase 4B-like [Paramacrobiotus metropolitanus]|uniref:terminal nucleotidyltransferase 4B-like n=1 Tax=Paramacrobiotus metropolitanus TaxID=2943436 RepID=UPI0024459659|nr:terminal nucleotidyltransferase 4B-like [Paramacrobiotus metropolitanus]